MRKNLCFFATEDDTRTLLAFAQYVGLSVIPGDPGTFSAIELQNYSDNYEHGGYLSFLPLDKLHYYGRPSVKVSNVTDPLISYIPPHYDPPNLIAGQIRWTGPLSRFGAQTKPYYAKLWRWVDKNWTKRLEDGYYLGPEAERLAEKEETQLYYFPPGVKIEKVMIPAIRNLRKENKKAGEDEK